MSVNLMIPDTLSQVGVTTMAMAPGIASSNLLLASNHALSLTAHNASLAQQQGYLLMQTTTICGVNSITTTGQALVAQILSRCR